MRLANSRLVQYMQSRAQTYFYGDTANYISRSETSSNTFGEPGYTETTTAIACSFTDKVSSEAWKTSGDVQDVEAEIRFSSIVPSKGDAITLTGHFDLSSFADKRYHIVGIKDRGALGYVCALKAIDL